LSRAAQKGASIIQGVRMNAMSRALFASALTTSLSLAGGAFGADQFGTPAEARAMLEQGVTTLKDNQAAALKAFNDEKNKQFRSKDLYVFCFKLSDGKFTAYQSAALLGVDVRELKLPPDDPIGQRAYDVVKNAPEGEYVTAQYKFPKPGTKASVDKEFLETHVGDLACGVTYFK
jgi:hypothetical protein